MIGIDQVKIAPRIATCLPLIAFVAVFLWWSNLSAKSFGHVWNYFAWGNQVIAATSLMASTVWLLRRGDGAKALVALVPGVFMTAVVVSFILWTSSDKGQPWGLVPGGLPLPVAIGLGFVVAVAFAFWTLKLGREGRKGE